MTGRHEGPAATGQGHLRAAHADRERVVAALQAAFVQGRLDKDELDARVGQALAARTYAELAALTADLPAGPAGVPAGPADLPSGPAGVPAGPADLPSGPAGVPPGPADLPSGSAAAGTAAAGPTRTPAGMMARTAYRSGIFLLLTVALIEGAFLTGSGAFLVLAAYAFMAFGGFFAYGVIDTWHERRARRQPPQAGQRGQRGPGPGGRDGRDGRELEGGRPGGTGRGPSPVRDDQNRAEVRGRKAGQDRRHPRGIPAPRGTGPVPGRA
jgi:Domain of unknown function (DUF1707)